MHKGIGPGLDAALRVVDIDFDIKRTGGTINRIGVADDRALEAFARELIESQCRLGAGLRGLRVNLWYSNIDAKSVNRRHVKQFLRHAASSCIDQRADVRVSCGNNTSEWS